MYNIHVVYPLVKLYPYLPITASSEQCPTRATFFCTQGGRGRWRLVERFDSLYPRHHQRLVNLVIIIKKILKYVRQRMKLLVANPLQFRPCFGFHCLQLVLLSNLFLSDVWQDEISWKQIDMDYPLGNTNKQTIEIRHDRTINFSHRKFFLKNDICLFNFLII